MPQLPERVTNPFLSLCMIVKNEGKNLRRCLESVQPYVDEMIIVDTGSEDETVEIAHKFGAKVSYFPWCDDFSAARNASLKRAAGEWILAIDADEELIVEDSDFRSRLEERPEVLAYAIPRSEFNLPSDALLGGFHLRLFQNLPEFHYVNRFHEQLQCQDDRPFVTKQFQGIRLLHYGNPDEETVRQKALTRNIPLLESIREQEGLNFWLLDCLARSYRRTEQAEKAEACYTEAYERLFPHLLTGEKPEPFFWVPTLIHLLAESACDRQDFEAARLLCQRGLEWCPNHLPLLYLTGLMLSDLGFPLGAIAYFQQCLYLAENNCFYSGEPFSQTLLNLDPVLSLGSAYMALNNWSEARSAFEYVLSLQPDCAIAHDRLAAIQNQQ